jgi:putative transposase
MRGPKAPKLVVSDRQRAILERFTRATTAAVSLVERSRIVLLSASGMATLHVAAALDVDRQRVRRWRHRWAKELSAKLTAVEAKADDKVLAAAIEEALADLPRPGGPPQFTEEQIARVRAIACQEPSEHGLPHTRWTRALIAQVAAQKGIVESVSVAEVGRWLKKGGSSPTGSGRG